MQVYEMYPLPGENKFNSLEFFIYFYPQEIWGISYVYSAEYWIIIVMLALENTTNKQDCTFERIK